ATAHLADRGRDRRAGADGRLEPGLPGLPLAARHRRRLLARWQRWLDRDRGPGARPPGPAGARWTPTRPSGLVLTRGVAAEAADQGPVRSSMRTGSSPGCKEAFERPFDRLGRRSAFEH